MASGQGHAPQTWGFQLCQTHCSYVFLGWSSITECRQGTINQIDQNGSYENNVAN